MYIYIKKKQTSPRRPVPPCSSGATTVCDTTLMQGIVTHSISQAATWHAALDKLYEQQLLACPGSSQDVGTSGGTSNPEHQHRNKKNNTQATHRRRLLSTIPHWNFCPKAPLKTIGEKHVHRSSVSIFYWDHKQLYNSFFSVGLHTRANTAVQHNYASKGSA